MNTIEILTLALLAVNPSGSASNGEPDAVWRLVEAATEAPDLDRRKELLREAELHARGAVEGHQDDVGRRYALAVVLGLRANVEGSREKVRVASDLITELDAILALEPGHVGARHILGRLHAAARRMGRLTRWIATNLLGGDALKSATWEAAEENLAFAEQHAPEFADHHLQLALLYRDTKRPELAVEELVHVMELQAITAMELAVQAEAMEVWIRLEETFGTFSTK